jgi:arylformamidase
MPTRLLDLSHDVVAGMITYPGLPGPTITDHLSWEASHQNYAPGVEFQIGRIDMVSNTGTYLDTPGHRYRDGIDLSGLPLESVANLPGLVITASRQAFGAEAFAGREIRGRAVLVHTGWARHWGTERYGAPDHPFLTADAAQSLVDAGAALVGIDSVNIDDTSAAAAGERPVHSRLLGAGIPIVEHLCGLEQLGAQPFTLFAVPVKVKGMGTFPVRAFAIIESADELPAAQATDSSA